MMYDSVLYFHIPIHFSRYLISLEEEKISFYWVKNKLQCSTKLNMYMKCKYNHEKSKCLKQMFGINWICRKRIQIRRKMWTRFRFKQIMGKRCF